MKKSIIYGQIKKLFIIGKLYKLWVDYINNM